jgi:hypothetical protein
MLTSFCIDYIDDRTNLNLTTADDSTLVDTATFEGKRKELQRRLAELLAAIDSKGTAAHNNFLTAAIGTLENVSSMLDDKTDNIKPLAASSVVLKGRPPSTKRLPIRSEIIEANINKKQKQLNKW